MKTLTVLGLLLLSAASSAGAWSFWDEPPEEKSSAPKAAAILFLPSSEKETPSLTWLKALEKYPGLRLSVAFSSIDMESLVSHRNELRDLVKQGRLDPALRLAHGPPLPLIYDMDLSKIYMRVSAPLPTEKVAWPDDMALPIVKERLEFKEFWGMSPGGFVPGGGSLSNPIADFLMKQKFYWTVAGFPDAEWTDDEVLALEKDGKQTFQIMKAHSLCNLLYPEEKDYNPAIPCCVPARPWVQKLVQELSVERRQAPVIVFDEARAKISGEDFLREFVFQTSTMAPGGAESIHLALCSEIKEPDVTDRQTASLQIWPYSWSWLRGIGSPSGPGLTAWVGDRQKNYAWDLLSKTRNVVERYRNTGTADVEKLDRALEEFYQAESGEFFEWFGSGVNEIEKDPGVNLIKRQKQMLFKATLENVYRHLDLRVPNYIHSTTFGGSSGPALPREIKPKAAAAQPETPVLTSERVPEPPVPLAAPGGRKKVFEWEDRPENPNSSGQGFASKLRKFSVAVSSSAGRDTVFFSITFNGSVPPENVTECYIDINHRPGAGTTMLLPGRNAKVPDEDAWELVMVSRWLPSRGWTASLHRSFSLNSALYSTAIQYKTSSRQETGTFEIRVPKSLVGESPGNWGFLVLTTDASGTITDFLGPRHVKESAWSQIKKINPKEPVSRDKIVTLPMIRQEGPIEEKN